VFPLETAIAFTKRMIEVDAPAWFLRRP